AQLDVKTIKVKLRRLESILRTHAPQIRDIDILSVDVEGWELEVLAGLDFSKYRPRVLVIENLFNDPAYRTQINTYGYLLWRTVPPNDVFIARQHWGKRRPSPPSAYMLEPIEQARQEVPVTASGEQNVAEQPRAGWQRRHPIDADGL